MVALSVWSMLMGWSLTIVANAPTSSPDETSSHIAFTATLGGGVLMFMGILAGISRWVAEPAARKVLREHTKDGVDAHPVYAPRSEVDSKHLFLLNKIEETQLMIVKFANLRGFPLEPR